MLALTSPKQEKPLTMTSVSLNLDEYRTTQRPGESESAFLARSLAESRAYFDTL